MAFCCRRSDDAAADGGTAFKIRPPDAAASPTPDSSNARLGGDGATQFMATDDD
jgi:hypothetical protein